MAEIVIQSGDGTREHFPLGKDITTIGRSRESDIFLPDQWLSRHHAEIRRRGEGWLIVDLDSKNGTLLTGQPVKGEMPPARTGDVITLGEHTLTFAEAGAAFEEDDLEPEGTRVFSARELSDINTKPAIDPTDLARQNRVLAAVSKATSELARPQAPLASSSSASWSLLFEAVPAERGAILLLEERDRAGPASRPRAAGPGRSITHVSRAISRKVLKEKVSLLLPKRPRGQGVQPLGVDPLLGHPLRHVRAALVQRSGRHRRGASASSTSTPCEKSYSFGEDDLRILTALAERGRGQDREHAPARGDDREAPHGGATSDVAAEIQQRPSAPRALPACPATASWAATSPAARWGATTTTSPTTNGRLLLALGDVAGKGVTAALIMTVLRAAVRDHWSAGLARGDRGPGQPDHLPERARQQVRHLLPRALDPATGHLAYVNAGHNPPVLVHGPRTGRGAWAKAARCWACSSPPSITEGTAQMRPGDTLLIYSDGISETFDPEGERVRGRGLAAVALRHEGPGRRRRCKTRSCASWSVSRWGPRPPTTAP